MKTKNHKTLKEILVAAYDWVTSSIVLAYLLCVGTCGQEDNYGKNY